MDSGFSSQHGLSSNFRASSVRTSHPGICSPNNCCWRFATSQSKSLTTPVVDDPIQNRFRTSLLAFIGRSRAGAEAKNARERGYWTPQILPLNSPFQWIVGEYNDAEGAARLVAEHARELAAVIVEPLQGAAGVIPGDPSFMHALREATTENGVLLVFDEVMTSRLSTGGMQQILGVDPDLTTLAKFVGGGLSFGAFGGRAQLMDRFDPSRPDALQHGGTFNNDVLTMAAGAAGLTQVLTDAEIERLNGLGDRLRDGAI